MQLSIHVRIVVGLVIGITASTALADPIRFDNLVTDVRDQFSNINVEEKLILAAAKNLFMAFATISLVWTMGLQIVRQDIGEAMMELLRFIIATGILYWLLINASDPVAEEGFVRRILGSFYQMTNSNDSDKSLLSYGNGAVNRALDVYMKVIGDTSVGDNSDRIVIGLIGVVVLVALTLLAAQFLLALIMAWFLAYGGIFLLGFGGSRWTSQIAINYYKHVVALGVAILALSFIGVVSANVFGSVIPTYGERGLTTYAKLGRILAISLMMLVLGLRVPQLLYTLVTGSSLGIFAGTAGMVGSAIATGGGAALASAGARFVAGSDAGVAGGSGGSMARASSAMEAIERSAASASAMSDPFHTSGGSDPFGVPRRPDALRSAHVSSVFSTASTQGLGELSGVSSARAGAGTSLETSIAEVSVPQKRHEVEADGEVLSTASGTSKNAAGSDVGRTAGFNAGEGQGEPQPDYRAEMAAIAEARSDHITEASVAAEDQALSPKATQHDDPTMLGSFDQHAVEGATGASAVIRQEVGSLNRHDVDGPIGDSTHVDTDASDAQRSASVLTSTQSLEPSEGDTASLPLSVQEVIGIAGHDVVAAADSQHAGKSAAGLIDAGVDEMLERAIDIADPANHSVPTSADQADGMHVPRVSAHATVPASVQDAGGDIPDKRGVDLKAVDTSAHSSPALDHGLATKRFDAPPPCDSDTDEEHSP